MTAQPFTGGEVPGELTEEWCNSQGMTLRESTGECITYEYKSAIESSRLQGQSMESYCNDTLGVTFDESTGKCGKYTLGPGGTYEQTLRARGEL